MADEFDPLDRARILVLSKLDGLDGTWTGEDLPVSRAARDARQILENLWGLESVGDDCGGRKWVKDNG